MILNRCLIDCVSRALNLTKRCLLETVQGLCTSQQVFLLRGAVNDVSDRHRVGDKAQKMRGINRKKFVYAFYPFFAVRHKKT